MSDKGLTRRELFSFFRRPAEEEAKAPPPLAVVHAERCVAFQGSFCDDCNRACPVPLAILFNNQGHPRVDRDRCIGCGECQRACPVAEPAITVPGLDAT